MGSHEAQKLFVSPLVYIELGVMIWSGKGSKPWRALE